LADGSAEGNCKGSGSEEVGPSERREHERRKHKRITSFATLVYRPLKKLDGQRGVTHYMPADSFNLSIGGALFCANKCMEIRERVKVRIRLFEVLAEDSDSDLLEIAGTSDLVAVAEVLRTEENPEGGYRMAIKFVDVIDGDLEALNAFIGKKEEHGDR